MRLPEVQHRTQVQSLGRENINAPIAVGQARGAAAMSLSKAGRDIASQYLNIQRKAELDDATLYSVEQSLKHKSEHETRIEYSGDELGPDIPVNKTTLDVDLRNRKVTEKVRQNIPSYEVRPDIYKSFMKGNIEAAASRISNRRDREQFIRTQEEAAANEYGRLKLESVSLQRDQLRDRQGDFIDESIRKREYGLARAEIGNFFGTREEKARKMQVVNKAEETDGYNDIISDGLVATKLIEMNRIGSYAEDAITILNDDEYKGTLNTDERIATIKKLQGILITMGNKGNAQGKANEKWLKYRTNNAIKALQSGIGHILTGDESQIPELYAAISRVDPVLTHKLEVAMTYSNQFKQMAFIPLIDHTLLAQESKRNIKTAEDMNLYNAMEAQLIQKESEIEDNSLAYSAKIGLIVKSTINFADNKKLGDSLSNRLIDSQIVQSQLQASTAFLYPEEITQISDMVGEMTVPQKLAFVGTVYNALGDQSYLLYEQLQLEGVGGVFATAGQIYSEGDIVSARTIMMGNQIMTDAPDMAKVYKPDLDAFVIDRLKNTYGASPEKYTSMSLAIKSAYAFLSATDGESGLDFNEDNAEAAYQMATGGLVGYNGSTLETPFRGMSQQGWDRWIDGLAPEAIPAMGAPQGYTDSQYLTGVREGDLKLIGFGKNQYATYKPKTNEFIHDKTTGDLFVFRWGADDITQESVTRARDIEWKKSGGPRKVLDKIINPKPIFESSPMRRMLEGAKAKLPKI